MCSNVSTDSLSLSADTNSLIQLQVLAAVDAITQQYLDPFLASSQMWVLVIAFSHREHSARAWIVIWASHPSYPT